MERIRQHRSRMRQDRFQNGANRARHSGRANPRRRIRRSRQAVRPSRGKEAARDKTSVGGGEEAAYTGSLSRYLQPMQAVSKNPEETLHFAQLHPLFHRSAWWRRRKAARGRIRPVFRLVRHRAATEALSSRRRDLVLANRNIRQTTTRLLLQVIVKIRGDQPERTSQTICNQRGKNSPARTSRRQTLSRKQPSKSPNSAIYDGSNQKEPRRTRRFRTR